MDIRATLLTRIEHHCAATGLGEREFGYAAVQDGRFVARLRDGKGTLKLLQRAMDHLDAKPKRQGKQPANASAEQAA